jgi:hypothetical protein
MPNPLFRVATIAFDEDEEVASVTARASTGTLGVIRELLGDVPWTVVSEQESEITLPVKDALELFRKCGPLTTGDHPQHEHTTLVWNSLNWVINSLIED